MSRRLLPLLLLAACGAPASAGTGCTHPLGSEEQIACLRARSCSLLRSAVAPLAPHVELRESGLHATAEALLALEYAVPGSVSKLRSSDGTCFAGDPAKGQIRDLTTGARLL